MKMLPLVVALALTACAQTNPSIGSADTSDVPVVPAGAVEVPEVQTMATGRALILVNDDGTISGIVEAPGMDGATAAIDDDAATPVVVMLVPMTDSRWQVPSGTRLTPAQMSHYKSGKLYANVRTKARPNGEVRGQLKGKIDTSAASTAAR